LTLPDHFFDLSAAETDIPFDDYLSSNAFEIFSPSDIDIDIDASAFLAYSTSNLGSSSSSSDKSSPPSDHDNAFDSTYFTPEQDSQLAPSIATRSVSPLSIQSSNKSSRAVPAEKQDLNDSFLFVDNNDKKQAARLRNALCARRHKKSKMTRLERLQERLKTVERERDEWKRKALASS